MRIGGDSFDDFEAEVSVGGPLELSGVFAWSCGIECDGVEGGSLAVFSVFLVGFRGFSCGFGVGWCGHFDSSFGRG